QARITRRVIPAKAGEPVGVVASSRSGSRSRGNDDKNERARASMSNNPGTILSRIKDEEIDWVDLRFTDPKGKWQHLTMASGLIDEDMLTDGFMFDGSSIAGWKAINESDMILKPDL